MNFILHNRWIKLLLATLALAASFGLGYAISARNEQGQFGERAMGCFMNELAALQYLENADHEKAKSMLIGSLDGLMAIVKGNGTPELDSQYPGEKQKYFARFEQLKNSKTETDHD